MYRGKDSTGGVESINGVLNGKRSMTMFNGGTRCRCCRIHCVLQQ